MLIFKIMPGKMRLLELFHFREIILTQCLALNKFISVILPLKINFDAILSCKAL